IPFSIAITRFLIVLTIFLLCVAIITVVPRLLISSKIRIILQDVSGSKLPVDSSAITISGLFAFALAMDTLCCSPLANSCAKDLNYLSVHLRLQYQDCFQLLVQWTLFVALRRIIHVEMIELYSLNLLTLELPLLVHEFA